MSTKGEFFLLNVAGRQRAFSLIFSHLRNCVGRFSVDPAKSRPFLLNIRRRVVSGRPCWAMCGARLGTQSRSAHHADLGNPLIYLQSCTTALDFATSLNAIRHPRAEIISANSRLGAWNGVPSMCVIIYQTRIGGMPTSSTTSVRFLDYSVVLGHAEIHLR